LFFQDKHEIIYDSVKAYIEITDTSGHRDFKENIKFSIKKADGVVFVIGNNDQYSLRRVREELLPLARAEAPKGVKFMLACNKTDLKR
jgi:GTPase SAR1 family protein